MKIGKGMIAGLGIASLLVALPAAADEKHGSASGSSGASSSTGSSGSSGSATDHSGSAGSSGTMGGSSGSMGQPGSSTAGGTTSAGAAGEQHITGKVEKVDEAKKQLTLQLKVDENTQVMKDGKSASLSDIKEGDQVRASFAGSQVQRIEVMSSGAGGQQRAPSGSPTAPGGKSTAPGGSSTAPGGSSGSSQPGSSGRGY